MLPALLTAFSLGLLYFISAIPAATMAGAPLWAATLLAWFGYSSGALIIILFGAPLRAWLLKKMNLSLQPDHNKIFWRIWNQYGVIGVGLIAPVTIGPEVAALLLLALGEVPKKIVGSIALGALPWALGFAVVIRLGLHLITRG
ncbi:MAG: hypothetical protein ACOYK6_07285 [Chthoniobacterales bacterium]